MADSLRELIASVITNARGDLRYSDHFAADALLADPTFAAICDLAARIGEWEEDYYGPSVYPSPEVRALLAAWRANRACTELTQEAQRLGLYDD